MRKNIQNGALTFCQQTDFTRGDSGPLLFDSSYDSVEREELLIIRDV